MFSYRHLTFSSHSTIIVLKAKGERNRPRKRRRLSLRLPRKHISTTQITNTQSTCTTTSIISSFSSSSLQLNDIDTSVSTDNVSLNKSTSIVNKNQSVFEENLLTDLNNSTTCHSSTVINYSVVSCFITNFTLTYKYHPANKSWNFVGLNKVFFLSKT